jgi:hypothetical protein
VNLTAKQLVVLTAVVAETERRREAGKKDKPPGYVGVSDWSIGSSVRSTVGFEEAWGRDRGSRQGFMGIAGRLYDKGLLQRDLWRRSYWPTAASYKALGRRPPKWLDRIDERGQLHPPLIRSTEEERAAAESILKALEEASVVYHGGIHNGARNATIRALRRVKG